MSRKIKIPYWGLAAVFALSLYIWTDIHGYTWSWWVNDGRSDVILGRPMAFPTPSPLYPVIVHPRIESAGTPRPNVRVPL